MGDNITTINDEDIEEKTLTSPTESQPYDHSCDSVGLVKVFSSISSSFIVVMLSQWSRYSSSSLILVVLTLRRRPCVSLHAHADPSKSECKFFNILDPFEVDGAGVGVGFSEGISVILGVLSSIGSCFISGSWVEGTPKIIEIPSENPTPTPC